MSTASKATMSAAKPKSDLKASEHCPDLGHTYLCMKEIASASDLFTIRVLSCELKLWKRSKDVVFAYPRIFGTR